MSGSLPEPGGTEIDGESGVVDREGTPSHSVSRLKTFHRQSLLGEELGGEKSRDPRSHHGYVIVLLSHSTRPGSRTIRKRAFPEEIRDTASFAASSGIRSMTGRTPLRRANSIASSVSRALPVR